MGIAEGFGKFLAKRTLRIKQMFVILTFMMVIFVHVFLLREWFPIDLTKPDMFMWLYLEVVVSLMMGGPILWFVIALIEYLLH